MNIQQAAPIDKEEEDEKKKLIKINLSEDPLKPSDGDSWLDDLSTFIAKKTAELLSSNDVSFNDSGKVIRSGITRNEMIRLLKLAKAYKEQRLRNLEYLTNLNYTEEFLSEFYKQSNIAAKGINAAVTGGDSGEGAIVALAKLPLNLLSSFIDKAEFASTSKDKKLKNEDNIFKADYWQGKIVGIAQVLSLVIPQPIGMMVSTMIQFFVDFSQVEKSDYESILSEPEFQDELDRAVDNLKITKQYETNQKYEELKKQDPEAAMQTLLEEVNKKTLVSNHSLFIAEKERERLLTSFMADIISDEEKAEIISKSQEASKEILRSDLLNYKHISVKDKEMDKYHEMQGQEKCFVTKNRAAFVLSHLKLDQLLKAIEKTLADETFKKLNSQAQKKVMAFKVSIEKLYIDNKNDSTKFNNLYASQVETNAEAARLVLAFGDYTKINSNYNKNNNEESIKKPGGYDMFAKGLGADAVIVGGMFISLDKDGNATSGYQRGKYIVTSDAKTTLHEMLHLINHEIGSPLSLLNPRLRGVTNKRAQEIIGFGEMYKSSLDTHLTNLKLKSYEKLTAELRGIDNDTLLNLDPAKFNTAVYENNKKQEEIRYNKENFADILMYSGFLSGDDITQYQEYLNKATTINNKQKREAYIKEIIKAENAISAATKPIKPKQEEIKKTQDNMQKLKDQITAAETALQKEKDKDKKAEMTKEIDEAKKELKEQQETLTKLEDEVNQLEKVLDETKKANDKSLDENKQLLDNLNKADPECAKDEDFDMFIEGLQELMFKDVKIYNKETKAFDTKSPYHNISDEFLKLDFILKNSEILEKHVEKLIEKKYRRKNMASGNLLKGNEKIKKFIEQHNLLHKNKKANGVLSLLHNVFSMSEGFYDKSKTLEEKEVRLAENIDEVGEMIGLKAVTKLFETRNTCQNELIKCLKFGDVRRGDIADEGHHDSITKSSFSNQFFAGEERQFPSLNLKDEIAAPQNLPQGVETGILPSKHKGEERGEVVGESQHRAQNKRPLLVKKQAAAQSNDPKEPEVGIAMG